MATDADDGVRETVGDEDEEESRKDRCDAPAVDPCAAKTATRRRAPEKATQAAHDNGLPRAQPPTASSSSSHCPQLALKQ